MCVLPSLGSIASGYTLQLPALTGPPTATDTFVPVSAPVVSRISGCTDVGTNTKDCPPSYVPRSIALAVMPDAYLMLLLF